MSKTTSIKVRRYANELFKQIFYTDRVCGLVVNSSWLHIQRPRVRLISCILNDILAGLTAYKNAVIDYYVAVEQLLIG